MLSSAHDPTFARPRSDCKRARREHGDALRELQDALRDHRDQPRECVDFRHESVRPADRDRSPAIQAFEGFLRLLGEPIAVKTERHPLRQGDPRHGSLGRFLSVQDDQVGGVAVLVVGVEQQPAFVFAGGLAVGHEDGFARNTSVRGVPFLLGAFFKIVFEDRRRGMLVGRQSIGTGRVTEAIG